MADTRPLENRRHSKEPMQRRSRTSAIRAIPAVQKSIQRLRAEYAKGMRIGREYPMNTPLTNRDDPEAEPWRKLGFGNINTFRQLRHVADPKRGFTPKELEDLIGLALACNYPLGITHLFITVTIPKKGGQRLRFLREMIRKERSVAEIKKEIRARFGRRAHGGRKPQLAKDLPGLLAQFDVMATALIRWNEACRETVLGDSRIIDQLPKGVRGQLNELLPAILSLRDTVGHELAKLRRRASRIPQARAN